MSFPHEGPVDELAVELDSDDGTELALCKRDLVSRGMSGIIVAELALTSRELASTISFSVL